MIVTHGSYVVKLSSVIVILTGGAIGRVSDLRFTGRGFQSWLGIIA